MVAAEWTPAFTRKEYDSDEPEENEMRDRVLTAITSLRQAIEQAEKQEPVAWCVRWTERKCDNCGEFGSCCQQPQREWVDLPDKLIDKTSWEFAEYEGFQHGARWAQTKLKELNT
jgi:hypothetical protein